MIPPCYDIPARVRPITKKALVIGISYREPVGELGPIPTSVPNVEKITRLLRDRGYTITVMTDGDTVAKESQPTGVNLRREIGALCHGAQPGDRHVFYFTGHSGQMPCRSGSREEDGMDEVLVAADELKIRDNSLYDLLAKDLPEDSALTAVFDSCTSGTLLDLPHHKCNDLYHPWANKGQRRSATLQNCVVRKNCGIMSPTNSRKGSREANSRPISLGYCAIQTMDGHPTTAPLPPPNDPDHHNGQRCVSPEPRFPCDGWCRTRMSTLKYPYVISISSSNDGQTSWDAIKPNGDSDSMTTFLVDILGGTLSLSHIDISPYNIALEKYPEPTLAELMRRLKLKEHSFTMGMHDDVKKESHTRHQAQGMNKNAGGCGGEMNDFQDIQLGSQGPLDMDQPFIL